MGGPWLEVRFGENPVLQLKWKFCHRLPVLTHPKFNGCPPDLHLGAAGVSELSRSLPVSPPPLKSFDLAAKHSMTAG